MSSDKPFRRIEELVAALAEAQRSAGAGKLDLAQLDAACDDARELYERWIVLRHKAREIAVMPTAGETQARADAQGSIIPPEPKPLRLDTRPVEVSPRQTSLIEAIESSEQEAPAVSREPVRTGANTTAKAPAKGPTLAERHEHAAVPDLAKAISLSHKFWFVAELFNGDRITYEKSIDKLNGFASLAEAEAFVQNEVVARLKKPADPEALATFNDLVQRRYA